MGYAEILEAVKQLPDEQFHLLKSEIDKNSNQRKDTKLKKKRIEKLLLNGPVMSDDDYAEFLKEK